MGLFGRKKKSSSTTSSPMSVSFSAFPSPVIPFEQHHLPVPATPSTITLRVLVDAAAACVGDSCPDLFHITVHPSDPVSAIRDAVTAELGASALSLFKVSVPWQAHYQTRAYTNRYGVPVNILTSFPSFNLDDPAQLGPSLGSVWRQDGSPSSSSPTLRTPTVNDWFPDVPSHEIVSVLARVAPRPTSSTSSSRSAVPLTCVAHVAMPALERSGSGLSRPTTPGKSASAGAAAGGSGSAGDGKGKRRAPVVVDVDPESSVDELKRALLRADGRGDTGRLERVTVWRVEMSEEEMVVIEERGGLRRGKMPWPYPPTSPVPVALDDGNASVASYFGNSQSNGRMVTLSVWIHPSAAAAEFARIDGSDDDAPLFQYPMPVSDHLSETGRQQMQACVSRSPSLSAASTFGPAPTVQVDSTGHHHHHQSHSHSHAHSHSHSPSPVPAFGQAATLPRRNPRSRPSTAPAAASPSSGAPAFGSNSLSARGNGRLMPTSSLRVKPRLTSPLSADPINAGATSPPITGSTQSTPTQPLVQGLGIALRHVHAPQSPPESPPATPHALALGERDRPSICSVASSCCSPCLSDDGCTSGIPQLNFSQLSLNQYHVPPTPENEDQTIDWLAPAKVVANASHHNHASKPDTLKVGVLGGLLVGPA